MRPLLVMDGDSFAHRAYHALPKSMRRQDGGPGNALIGFTNMLLRLWHDERPRTVLVAWDRLDVPTYRHTALEAYQSGRVFDDELVEQLDLLPALVRSAGFACAKEPGYEADDFLAAAATQEEAARRDGAGCHVGPRRVPARDRSGDRPPAGTAERRRHASGQARCATATAWILRRYPTSSPSAVIRRTRSRERAGSGQNAPQSSSSSTRRSMRCSRKAASPRKPRRSVSISASRRWIAPRRSRRFPTSLPSGTPRPRTHVGSGSSGWRAASRRPSTWT